jgi:hypothetical protein
MSESGKKTESTASAIFVRSLSENLLPDKRRIISLISYRSMAFGVADPPSTNTVYNQSIKIKLIPGRTPL